MGSPSRSQRFFFFQAEDGIRDVAVTGVQTCALPISFAVRAHRDRVGVTPRRSGARRPRAPGHASPGSTPRRSEEHTSELQSRLHLVCRLLLEKKKKESSFIKEQQFTSHTTGRSSATP